MFWPLSSDVSNLTYTPSKENRPFRFEATWLTHDAFPDIFRLGNKYPDSLPAAIQSLTDKVIDWRVEVFGDIFVRKKKLLNRIRGIQRSSSYGLSNFLNFFLLRLNSFRNISLSCHRKNSYGCRSLGRNGLSMVGGPRLTDEVYPSLTMHLSLEEVRDPIFYMKGLKAPGPDGIQPLVFQKQWGTVQHTLNSFVQGALSSGRVLDSVLKAHLLLIPNQKLILLRLTISAYHPS